MNNIEQVPTLANLPDVQAAISAAISAAGSPVPRASSYTYGPGRVYQTNFSNQTLDALNFTLSGLQYGTDAGGKPCVYMTGTNPNTDAFILTKQNNFKDVDVRVKWKSVTSTTSPYAGTNSPAYNITNILPQIYVRYQQPNDQWYCQHSYSNGGMPVGSISNGSSASQSVPETDTAEASLYHWMRMRIIEECIQVKCWKNFATTTSAASAAGTSTLTLASVAGLFGTGATPNTSGYTVGDTISFQDSQGLFTTTKVASISGNVITLSIPLVNSVASGSGVYTPEPDWQYTGVFRDSSSSANSAVDNCDIGAAGFSLRYGGIISEVVVTELIRKDNNILHNSDLRLIRSDTGNPVFWSPVIASVETGCSQSVVTLADRFGVSKNVLQFTQALTSSGGYGWTQTIFDAMGGATAFGTRQRRHPASYFPRFVEVSVWTKGVGITRSASGLGPCIDCYQYDVTGGIVMTDEGDTGAPGYVAGLGPPSPVGVSPVTAGTYTQAARFIGGAGYERLEPSAIGTWDWTETRFRMAMHQSRNIVQLSVHILFHDTGTLGGGGQIYFTEPVFRPAE